MSKLAARVVKYNFENPGGPKPKWLKRKGSVSDYLREYFEFPTPGKATRNIKPQIERKFLFRWHKEYQYFCEYSHVSMLKMVLQTMSEFKDIRSAEKTKLYAQKQAVRAVFMSYTATACSCSQVMRLLSHGYGAVEELESFWEVLYKSSLPSKALWEMYIKSLFDRHGV